MDVRPMVNVEHHPGHGRPLPAKETEMTTATTEELEERLIAAKVRLARLKCQVGETESTIEHLERMLQRPGVARPSEANSVSRE
jgi:hypothetical protein